MANPTRIEVNCTTGEVLEIELTDEEVAQREADAAAHAAAEAQRQAQAEATLALKESARAKLISGQLLNADEAALLVP